jgi:hypothetical protein
MKCNICLYPGPFNKQHITVCRFGGGKLVRYECPVCNVIFGTEEMINMSTEDLGNEYLKLYARGHKESDATARELNTLKFLKPTQAGTYLNWGAGKSTLNTATKVKIFNYDPYIESSKTNISDKSKLQTYDGIMSCNFLEHLQDPVGALTDMARHLTPRGVMAHSTPCYRYEYEYTKFHLYFFLGKSVNIMSDRAGLKAIRTGNPDVVLYNKK